MQQSRLKFTFAGKYGKCKCEGYVQLNQRYTPIHFHKSKFLKIQIFSPYRSNLHCILSYAYHLMRTKPRGIYAKQHGLTLYAKWHSLKCMCATGTLQQTLSCISWSCINRNHSKQLLSVLNNSILSSLFNWTNSTETTGFFLLLQTSSEAERQACLSLKGLFVLFVWYL